MSDKKGKPRALAGAGAEIEVGVTDCVDDNTAQLVPSRGSAIEFDSGDMEVVGVGVVTPGPRESFTALIRRVTMDYLASLDPDDPPAASDAHEGMMEATFRDVYLRNSVAMKEDKWAIPSKPEMWQVAQWVKWRLRMVVIEMEWQDCTDEQRLASRRVGRYVEETGVYTTEIDDIVKYAREFAPLMKERDKAEVMDIIRTELELDGRVVRPNRDPNLVCVGNGIYDIGKRELLPHTPDIVFLTRSDVDYNPDAELPVITMPDGELWDIETAMMEFAGGDAEVNLLLWQMLASAVRPDVYTGKMLLFYGKHGNNGKGTLITLGRNLVGASSCGAYNLASYSEDSSNRFELKGIERISANLVDENDILHIASAARLRAAITGDVFKVQVKNKDSYFARQRGVNVQCVNDLPTFKSKGGNMLRRMIIVPFRSCFTGVERPYIKRDYMARQDVLEYVLKRVLEMEFHGFTEPAACRRMLQVFEEGNNAVLSFLYEFLPVLKWDLAPKAFLYDLYKAWHADINPAGKRVRRTEFWQLVEDAIARHGDELGWKTTGKRIDQNGREVDKAVRPGFYMTDEEPLAVAYRLEKWTKPKYKGGLAREVGLPEKMSESYAGLVRVSPRPDPDDGVDDSEERAAYAAFVERFNALDAAERAREHDSDGNPVRVQRGPHGWRKAYKPYKDGGWCVNSDIYPDRCESVGFKPEDGDGPITYAVWLQHMQLCPLESVKHPERDFDCDVCGIHYKASPPDADSPDDDDDWELM